MGTMKHYSMEEPGDDMSQQSSAPRESMTVPGSAMWRRGRVPIGTFGMSLTLTDQGLALSPRNALYRVLWSALRPPVLTVGWDEVTSVGMVRGLSILPRQGILFQLRNREKSFVFASWRMNEAVLTAVAAHGIAINRGSRTFNPWRSTSWQNE